MADRLLDFIAHNTELFFALMVFSIGVFATSYNFLKNRKKSKQVLFGIYSNGIIKLHHSKCIGCKKCTICCKQDVLEVYNGKVFLTPNASCIGCACCVKTCPNQAIEKLKIDKNRNKDKQIKEHCDKRQIFLSMALLVIMFGCGDTERPQYSGASAEVVFLQSEIHLNSKSCNECHEVDRPNDTLFPARNREELAEILNDSDAFQTERVKGHHYNQKDCLECHNVKSWKFNHTDYKGDDIKYCLPCHYERGKNATQVRPDHSRFPKWFVGEGTCYQCHKKRYSWELKK